MKDLVIFLLQEITAQVEGQRPFHDPCGSVETPLAEFDADIAGCIKQGIVPNMGRIRLQMPQEPAEKNGIERVDQVSANEHHIDQDIFFLFITDVPPGGAKQRKIRIGHEICKLLSPKFDFGINVGYIYLCQKGY